MFRYDTLLKHKHDQLIAPLKNGPGFFRDLSFPFLLNVLNVSAGNFQGLCGLIQGATFKTLTIPTRKDARRNPVTGVTPVVELVLKGANNTGFGEGKTTFWITRFWSSTVPTWRVLINVMC